MTGEFDRAGLMRALEISRQLVAVAESGEARSVADLDAERLRLLDSTRRGTGPLGASERQMVREINDLNDKAIGFLEHHRRRIEREMDTVGIGRRAIIAYSAT